MRWSEYSRAQRSTSTLGVGPKVQLTAAAQVHYTGVQSCFQMCHEVFRSASTIMFITSRLRYITPHTCDSLPNKLEGVGRYICNMIPVCSSCVASHYKPRKSKHLCRFILKYREEYGERALLSTFSRGPTTTWDQIRATMVVLNSSVWEFFFFFQFSQNLVICYIISDTLCAENNTYDFLNLIYFSYVERGLRYPYLLILSTKPVVIPVCL